MMKHLSKINRNLFIAAERQITQGKNTGGLHINHLDFDETLNEKAVLINIVYLSTILKSPETSYLTLKYSLFTIKEN
jgi:hypothetical protein